MSGAIYPLAIVLKGLFSGGGSENLLGVELTSETIAVAQLKQQGSSLKLTHFATTPMPSGAMEDDKILDPQAVGLTLLELLNENRIKQTQVASAIPGRDAIVRLLRLPADLPEDELRNTVLNQEAELYIPFPREEADIDFQPLGINVSPDGAEEIEVLLVATPREIVDNYLSVMSVANLEVNSIELASFALIRAIKDQLAQFGQQEAIALASIGYEVTQLSIIVSGVPQFTRTINIGTAEMQQVLGQALNVPAATSDSLLKSLKLPIVDPNVGSRPTGNPGSAAVARVLTDLADELQRSIDFYANQDGSASVVQILLAGQGASLKDIDVFLGQQLSQTVSLVDPLNGVSVPQSIDIPEGMRASIGVAVGLGMRES